MTAWFDVSKDGLSKLVARRGSHWILAELLQNAWDAPGVTMVTVTVEPAGRGLTRIVVKDDSPVGFANLTHAFTIFADSGKKGDPSQRGRFNLGEKLVLSLCNEAEIATTTGTVHFGPEGRRNSRSKRTRGTTFRGLMRLNKVQADDAVEAVRRFIPPQGIRTLVNGVELERRVPVRTFECTLPTEIADEEGVLKRTKRKVTVNLYHPPEGMPGTVFEMGIPVNETGDQFDVDIGQKVPLSFERDTLLPSFLRDLRVAILNNATELLEEKELASDWVAQAIGTDGAAPEAVSSVVTRRFGEKVVTFDMNDREANDRAVAEGYVVLHGSAFNRNQWNNVKAAGIVKPAGQVTPTPKPFSSDGEPAEFVDPTPAMERFEGFVRAFCKAAAGVDVHVSYLKEFNASAAYGSRNMSFNVTRLGKAWFEGPLRQGQVDLVIHELGHEYEGNHLSKNYNDALTRLGARAVMLALENPGLFDLSRYGVSHGRKVLT
jgi:hypothetical protein